MAGMMLPDLTVAEASAFIGNAVWTTVTSVCNKEPEKQHHVFCPRKRFVMEFRSAHYWTMSKRALKCAEKKMPSQTMELSLQVQGPSLKALPYRFSVMRGTFLRCTTG
ncbi:uncharacterized protein LOC128246655 [Mya arenaria]|uniref:uncharacterized protein LOC128246655 n=1 Tax=Mya arenaria TaxID=6604 RepID=UPI0022DF3967|nr:uncharacterized protein LOC128246655 [Mya arenaria]